MVLSRSFGHTLCLYKQLRLQSCTRLDEINVGFIMHPLLDLTNHKPSRLKYKNHPEFETVRAEMDPPSFVMYAD